MDIWGIMDISVKQYMPCPNNGISVMSVLSVNWAFL